MILHQHQVSPSDQPTLAALWRQHALRSDPRVLAFCVIVGAVAMTASAVVERALWIALPGAMIAAFGCYSAVLRPTMGGRWLTPRAQQALAGVIAGVAMLAGISLWFFVFGVAFSGSLEVMRR